MKKVNLTQEEIRFNKFKKGDERAFEFYFKTYFDHIVGFNMQFIRDEAKSKSFAQEAFIKLWVNRKKVNAVNGVKSFLYTSAKSDCLNFIRHKKVVKNYKDEKLEQKERELNIEVLNSLKFDLMSFSELEGLIEKSIAELPEKCRVVFVKKRFENKKNKEVADELGISVKAVEANMTRSLKLLKIKLAEYLPSVLISIVLEII